MSNQKQNNDQNKKTPSDDETTTTEYETAESHISVATSAPPSDKDEVHPVLPQEERKSQFQLFPKEPTEDVEDKEVRPSRSSDQGKSQFQLFPKEPTEDVEDNEVRPSRSSDQRKSRVQLVDVESSVHTDTENDILIERKSAARKSNFQLAVDEEASISEGKQKPDSTSDDDITDYEKERRVTHFDDYMDGTQRAKRYTKTKADARPTSIDEVSSTDMSRLNRISSARLGSSALISNLAVGKIFIYVVVPPDGGYGWFIMVISFLCQVVVDGLIFAIGILMPYMAADLQVSQAQIVLVVSIQVGCYFLSGPISSAMINKYGFRPVILTGTVMATLAILAATLSPNLPLLILFYSIIGGPTLSMIWVTSQLIIGYYFEKYRPLAYGISVSGAGAGIVVAAAMNSHVVELIGWRNTLRIHSALLTGVFLMGLSFVEVAPSRVAHINESDFETETDDSEQYIKGSFYRYSRASMPNLTERISNAGGLRAPSAAGLEQMLVEYTKPTQRNWCACCCGPRQRLSRDDGAARQRLVVRTDFLERQDVYYTGPIDYDEAKRRGTVFDGRPIEMDQRNRRATEYTLSVLQATPHAAEERRKTLRELRETERCAWLAYIAPSNWLPAKMVNAFKMLFDMRLLAMSEFQILLASAFFFPMGFNIPFVYSKVRAEIPLHLANLISPSIGASNFVFRIISGVIAYKYRDFTTYVCGFGLVFGGVATFVSAFYGHNLVWFQFTYAVCYGVAPAFYSTLRAIIYVRALGLEKLTNAFGLTGVAMGLGVFIGTTLAGIFNQKTGSYTASFAFGGLCMIVAGGLKVILPSFMRWKETRLMDRKVQFT